MKLCTACHRHVRPAEAACPFCGEALRAASALPLGAVLLLGALGAACTERPNDSGSASEGTSTGTSTSTSTSTTASPTSTTTGTSGPSGSSSGEQSSAADVSSGDPGCSFYGGCPTDFHSSLECDPWAQDCPDGQKCSPAPTLDRLICVPVDPNAVGVGEPCVSEGGVDTCIAGAVCWDVDPDTHAGTCVAQCTGSPGEPVCADPATICVITNDGVITFCLPRCDPLAQDCPDMDLCIGNPNGDPGFVCVLDASGPGGQEWDPCSFANGCDPGLICGEVALAVECDQGGDGCCLPFCDTGVVPAVCKGMGQECIPFFGMGMAPMGLENVGFCGVP